MSEESRIALLVTDPTNIRYLTGFIGAAPEEREAYVLVTPNQTYLFTNALYIEQAKKLFKKPVVIQISRENPLSKELATLCTKLHINDIGFEDVNLTVAELTKLKQVLSDITLTPMRNSIEKKREIKSTTEIEFIRKASHITDECFTHILSKLKPGVTEAEIAWEMQTFFRKNDATDAFSPIVAYNSNASMPHYMPGSVQLTPNSLILMDYGARYRGYCSDMTRVVFLGKPKDEWVKGYAAVLEAQSVALNALEHNERSGKVLDELSQSILKKHNLPAYPHSLGHALGLDIHESPRLSRTQDSSLKPNMVITIEPGVYIENSYGVRIEDTVLIGEDSIEILTQSPKEITVL